jgi:iron complex outermembrane receptor protein
MRHLLLGSALLTSFALSSSFVAHAQDDERKLDSVIITSTPGAARSADELIGNASRIDRGELLEKLNTSLGNTLANEPGVSSTYFGPAASRPVIRGLGSERVLVLSNGVGVIDASASSPDHQVSAEGIDAESVEILRGPAALAYGGQAIAGVVNVIDGNIVETKPEDPVELDLFAAHSSVSDGTELAGKGRFTAGDFVFSLSGSLTDHGEIDIPGYAESALQRAAEEAEHEEHEEEGEEHEDEDHDHEEEAIDVLENSFVQQQTLATGISWVGDTMFAGVGVRMQESQYGLIGHSHAHEEEHEGEEEGEEEHGDEEHGEEEGVGYIDLEQLRYDVRFGKTFESGPISRAYATVSVADYEHTEFEAVGEAGTVFSSEGYEGRVELDHNAILGFEGAFGVQFSDTNLEAVGEESFISDTDTKTLGVFLYEAKEFKDLFGVELGLRYDNTEVENITAGTRDFDTVSGSFGLHKHLTDEVFVGGQVSYTERAPTNVQLFADGPHFVTNQFEEGNADLDIEAGTNFEITARWSSDSLLLGTNIFVTSFNDFIYLTPEEEGAHDEEEEHEGEEDEHGHEEELPHFVYTQNDAEFIGAEFYVEALLGEALGASWKLDGSLDVVDANFDGGAAVPFIPPMSTRLGLEADWKAITVGTEVIHAADQEDPGEGSFRTDGYTLFNASIGVAPSALGLPLEGANFFAELRNITDEEARLATSVLKDLAPLPGRNLRVGLRYSF